MIYIAEVITTDYKRRLARMALPSGSVIRNITVEHVIEGSSPHFAFDGTDPLGRPVIFGESDGGDTVVGGAYCPTPCGFVPLAVIRDGKVLGYIESEVKTREELFAAIAKKVFLVRVMPEAEP